MVNRQADDQIEQKIKPENIEHLLKDFKDIQSSIIEHKKDLTILFSDIKGSTEYFDRKGDIDGLLLLEKHNQLLFPIIKEEGGDIIKTLGDAIMAAFEDPVASVSAAERMQRALYEYNRDKSEREQIHVRIGLNTGQGFIKEKDVFGGVVNIAARIESLAGPDEILISESTHRSIQAAQRFKSNFLKKARLKGIKREMAIYKVFFRAREDILPFSNLLQRIENAKSLRDRHRYAMLLMDTIIRILAIVSVTCFMERGEDDPGLKNTLKNLAFPAPAHFTRILREILEFFEKIQAGQKTGLSSLRNFLLIPRKDLNRTVELFDMLSDYLWRKKPEKNAFKIIDFFELFCAYKASVGDKDLTGEGIYLDHGSLLFHSAFEILESLDFFKNNKLLFLEQIVHREGGLRLTFRELKGEIPFLITEQVPFDANFRKGNIYIKLSDNTSLSLYPYIVHIEDELGKDVYFLDRDEWKKSLRLVSLSSGKWFADPNYLASFRTFLTEIIGVPVDESIHAELIEEVINQEKEFLSPRITGKLLGDFEILEKLGEGAMGAVFKAKQLSLGRTVAVKTLPIELSKNKVISARFRREITVLGRCDHPNIVKVIASGEEEDSLYYAMEYIEGASLSEVFDELSRVDTNEPLAESILCQSISAAVEKKRKDRMEPYQKKVRPSLPDKDYYKKIARYGIDATMALKYIHERNIIHRDVKPSNFMVTEDGERLVLMDFGLARYEGALTLTTVTTEKILGTIRYASAQQIAGIREKVDHRTDIYSLAATLYELVSLKPIFDAESQPALMNKVLVEEPAPLKKVNPNIPDDLATIIHKGLEKAPENRYATAEDMAQDLRCFVEGEPILAKPPSAWKQVKHLAKKHKGAFVAALTILVLLVFGGTISLFSWQKAEVALDHKELALKAANRNLAIAWSEKSKLFIEQRDYQRAYMAVAAAIIKDSEALGAEAFSNLLLARSKSFFRYLKKIKAGFSVKHLDISDDGKIIVAADTDTIKLWNLQSGKQIGNLIGHQNEIRALDISPDGRTLAYGGTDKTIRLWDIPSERVLRVLEMHRGSIYSVRFSPDGQILAAAGQDNKIRLFHVPTAKEIGVLSGNESAFVSLAFSPDGKTLISKTVRNETSFWDIRTMKGIASFGYSSSLKRKRREDVSASKSLAFLQGGNLLATNERNGVQLWDINSKNKLAYHKVEGAYNIVSVLSLDNDNILLISEESGDHIMVWDVVTRQLVAKLYGRKMGELMALSKSGSILISKGENNTIRVWQKVVQEGFDTLPHDSEVVSIHLLKDGRKMYSALKNGNIVLWDLLNHEKRAVIEGPLSNKQNYHVSFSPDQETVASLSEDTIYLWNLKNGGYRFYINLSNEFKIDFVNVFKLSFLLNGKILACWGYDADQEGMFPKVVFWDAGSGKRVNSIGGRDYPVLSMAVSPDGQRLALGGVDGKIKLLNAASFKEIDALRGLKGSVFAIMFSPDGSKLASKTRQVNGEHIFITIWDLKTGRRRVIKVEADHMGEISFSPNSRLLASTDKKRVFLWDTHTGALKAAIEKPKDMPIGFDALTFTPDGKKLIVNDLTFFDRNIYFLDFSSILKSPSAILRDAEEYTGLRIDEFKIVSQD